MKKCNLQSLKKISKYLMIIFLPILVYIILGIILKLFNFSSEIFDLLITLTVIFFLLMLLYVLLI